MPELPEVEHARRWIERKAAGRRLVAYAVPDLAVVRTRLSTSPHHGTATPERDLEPLVGRPLLSARRWGKRYALIWDAAALVGHLGMTGRWVSGRQTPHARLGLHFEGAEWVWMEDTRRFGCVVVSRGDADTDTLLRAGQGPDPWLNELDGPTLRLALSHRSTIKARLMDQARIAGLGNIQTTEALWGAGIHPDRPAQTLTDEDWRRLAQAIRAALVRTLGLLGPDDEIVYVSSDKKLNPFSIYGRAGEPCPTCRTTIEQIRIHGRSSAYCPACQPARLT